ncbi:hypothetical protein Tco_0591277 [Tanacetum coccineum]
MDVKEPTFDNMANDADEPQVDPKSRTPHPQWVNVAKPPLTFDELMSTPIDFSAFAMHGLQLTTITREVLLGYDHLVDMSKPLPLQEKGERLIILIEVFFDNDLEYLKGDKSERT